MNLSLSKNRAESVLSALRARRVVTGGFTATGYGEANPIADNATEEGREANRRIEFRLLADAPAAATGTDAVDPEASAPDAAPQPDTATEPDPLSEAAADQPPSD